MAYKEFLARNRTMTAEFRGLNCHERIGDGQWTDMLNLTADEYPVEKTREKRAEIRNMLKTATVTIKQRLADTVTLNIGIDYRIANDILPEEGTVCTVTSGDISVQIEATDYRIINSDPKVIMKFAKVNDTDNLYNIFGDISQAGLPIYLQWAINKEVKGKPADAAVIEDKLYVLTAAGRIYQGDKSVAVHRSATQIVPIGRKLFTNSGAYVDQDLESFESARWSARSMATVELVNDEAEVITPATTIPTNPSDGDYYYDAAKNGLYRWSAAQSEWISIAESYILFTFEADAPYSLPDLSGLRAGDAVEIRIGEGDAAAYIVHTVDDTNHLLSVHGLTDTSTATAQEIVTERRMPVMDYICEHDNRVWGCRYGNNDKGEFVNEIYACTQGDPLSWFVFEGTAKDSWMTSVGVPGPWTGCCACGDYVYFFKEDKIFVVSGSVPGNFGYETLDDFGIQRGSEKSVAVIDNYVYFKSAHGIMKLSQYSYPTCISRVLGDDRWTDAVGGTDGRKYYVSMAGSHGRSLYVYDTESGIWTRETEPADVLAVTARFKNNLLAISAEDLHETGDLNITYDDDAAIAAYPAEGSAAEKLTWSLEQSTSKLWAQTDIVALMEEFQVSSIDDLYDALQAGITGGTLFLSVEKIGTYGVRYTFISNEKPTDVIVNGMQTELVTEDDFSWFAVTGPLGLDLPDQKRLREVQIRAKSGPRAVLRVYAAYDEENEWTEIRHENRGKTGTYRIVWTPARRCDTFRLRFAGIGETVIYSITMMTEDAGDYV